MFARLVAMLAILAITVVTTMTVAHAARMDMSTGLDHAAHVGATMHIADMAQPACDGEDHCGPADAGMCDFVCAGLAAFLAAPGAEAGPAHASSGHDFPSEAIHVGRAPGLNERPPKHRLL